MKSLKNTKSGIVNYGIISCISNLLAAVVVSVMLKTIAPLISTNAFLVWMILLIGVFAVSLGISFLALKNKVPLHYQSSEDKYFWLKNGLHMILPGEIFRFFLCFFTLGHIGTTGLLSIIPTFVFEQTYAIWTRRTELIRQEYRFIFGDFVAYTVCYLLYFMIYLVAILAIYRFLWNIGKREREELIVRESKLRFY